MAKNKETKDINETNEGMVENSPIPNAGIDPQFTVDVVGQTTSHGYPSQGLTGIALSYPEDGWETMAFSKENMIYGQPAFRITKTVKTPRQPATGLIYISQKYNVDYEAYYTADNLYMVLQTYANQVPLHYGTSLAENIALNRQPLNFTVGRLNVLDTVRLELEVYSMQANLSAQINAPLYVLKGSAAQDYPVFILNNDPTVTPDPTLYIATPFKVVQVLKQVVNFTTGTTLVELMNTL